MTTSMNLTIAGVHLAIHSPHPILHVMDHSPYRSFLQGAETPGGAVDVDVQLKVGNIPATEGLTALFGDQSWSLFQDTQFYYLKFHAAVEGEPTWLARFEPSVAQVTVFCSDNLLHQGRGDIAIMNPVHYPLDQILLMYALAQHQGALIHAAGAAIGGKGFVFAGQSSAGKTTLSRLLAGCEGIELLSDDRVVLRKMDDHFHVFGTPWAGEARVALNSSAPLAAILFLRHGPDNSIKSITVQAALESLLPVTSIPWYNRKLLGPMLSFCEDLVSHISTFELYFTPGSAVVQALRELASAQSVVATSVAPPLD